LFACFFALCTGVSFARHFSITLKSVRGNFVTAENGGGGDVNATRFDAHEWETFILLDLNDDELNDHDPVAIKTVNGRFFSALNGGADRLVADRTALREWETFTIERLTVRNNDSQIRDGDRVAIKSLNKNYVSAVNGGGGQVNARPFVVTNSETFTIRMLGEPPRMKLSGPFNSPQMILPSPVGLDETVNPSGDVYRCKNSYFGNNFPNCYRGHEGTDFGLAGGFATMNLGSIEIYTVASGKVVAISDGNPDRCYFKFPPPPANSRAEDFVFCPNDPNNQKRANFVVVLQDDGVIAYYYHMKRETVAVSVGSRVDCGQYIGKVGSSGISSMPHLHLTLETVPSDHLFPRDAAGFASIAGDRSQATMVNPYAPMLWMELIGRVPKKVCSSSVGDPDPADFSRDLGQSCPRNPKCRLPLLCDHGVCRQLLVPLGGSCSSNEICGPGLGCDRGRCVLRRP
jgi:murein DD-endopeptidase MepM/ murein hydrolase activator NlpD